MSNFNKGFLLTVVGFFLGFLLFGCSKPGSNYTYTCVTPVGEINISSETDTDVHMNDGVLQASRNGKSIAIPFSQCVAIKEGGQ